MKKKKIFVAIPTGTAKIEAIEIKVPEQKKLRFFFHATVYAGYLPNQFDDDRFTIREFSTGLFVCKLQSKAACIAKLRERLKTFGEEKILEIGKPVLARHGIAYPVNQ